MIMILKKYKDKMPVIHKKKFNKLLNLKKFVSLFNDKHVSEIFDLYNFIYTSVYFENAKYFIIYMVIKNDFIVSFGIVGYYPKGFIDYYNRNFVPQINYCLE